MRRKEKKMPGFCCLLVLTGFLAAGPAFAQGPAEGPASQISARIERLQARYQISFKYADFPKMPDILKFKEISAAEEGQRGLSPLGFGEYRLLDEYLALFEEEISKYPAGFFKDRDVRGIGFVRALFFKGKSAQGLYNHGARVMFFDISRFRRNKAQQRHSIHHEIFHMMMEKKGYPLFHEQWAALNSAGFSYGKQSKPLRELNPHNTTAPNQLGFVTYYAMESAAEDQAEVFACLMQAKHRKIIEGWALKDEAMAKKVQMIKDFAQYYHPEMGEQYWTGNR